MSVCIVDTSVVLELLDVPSHANAHAAHRALFEQRAQAKEEFLLALPVLFETGNHVAQLPHGQLRYTHAKRFIDFARSALAGQLPFVPTQAPSIEEVRSWLDDFHEHAIREVGLVDRSLIDLFERQRGRLKGRRRVYIWSLDRALQAYDTCP